MRNIPLLNRYFIHPLDGDHLGMTTIIGNYRWRGSLINLKKAQLGLLLNVVVSRGYECH